MSHFVVLVFGKDVEGQLAPYNENICVEPYWKDEAFQPSDHWGYRLGVEEGKITADASMEDLCGFLNIRYAGDGDKYRVDSGVLQRQTDYNPKSEWDWWVVGGRWSDMLRTLDGKPCDEGLISEIDWAGMESEAASDAASKIDDVLAITAGRKMPKPWKHYLDKYPNEIEKAREEYHAQPVLKAIQAHDHLRTFMADAVEYYCLNEDDPRQAFIDKRVDAIPSCYAIVKDGKWIAQGQMGWWGMSNDTVDDEVWHKQVKQFIRDNPDEYITVVDCHI